MLNGKWSLIWNSQWIQIFTLYNWMYIVLDSWVSFKRSMQKKLPFVNNMGREWENKWIQLFLPNYYFSINIVCFPNEAKIPSPSKTIFLSRKKMWWISWYLDRLMKESNEEVFETVQIISICWIMSLICMNLKEIFHYCCLMKPRKGWSVWNLESCTTLIFQIFYKEMPYDFGINTYK